ncbi:MAG: hypothetical protein JJ863_21350 [Deltaproteobacteria bacterium]|nr:hypothetical protein [Deltaproteobacteria bacterium]
MTSQLQLKVSGRTVAGFEKGEVTASMDRFASTFSLEYFADKLEGGGSAILEAGEPVELAVDGEPIFGGHIEDDEDDDEPGRTKGKLIGTSKLGDIVECSTFSESQVFRDISLIDLATELTKDYGIAIFDETEGIDPFGRWKLTEGTTIAVELQKAAKARGVVLLDQAGDLVLANAGAGETRTRLPGTIATSSKRTRSWKGRFSEYVVKGKGRRRDEDTGNLTTIREVVTDEGVDRLRRMVVPANGESVAAVRRRAFLERNQRAGRSERIVYRVRGWHTEEGDIWRPNTRVKVEDERRGIDAVLLVVRTTLKHGISEHRTELELTRPEAFDAVVDYPARRRGTRWQD